MNNTSAFPQLELSLFDSTNTVHSSLCPPCYFSIARGRHAGVFLSTWRSVYLDFLLTFFAVTIVDAR